MQQLNRNEIEKRFGKIVIEWQFSEFEKLQKGDLWFITFGVIAGALLIYSVFTSNFLFALIIVLTYFIIFIRQAREPEMILFVITEQGIILDNYFYAFHELKKFWIIYKPPEVKFLYIDVDRTLSAIKRIPLLDINPLFIREVLLNHISEDLDKQEEPFSDTVGRILKL